MEKLKNKVFLYIIASLFLYCTFFITNVNAYEDDDTLVGTVILRLGSSYQYNDTHYSNSFSLDGNDAFCIQRGVTIKDKIDETEQTRLPNGEKLKTIADSSNFKGWGEWVMNNDSTLATQNTLKLDGVPSAADTTKQKGAKSTYPAEFVVSNNPFGLDLNALALINTLADGCYELQQALYWAVQFGFITYGGADSNSMTTSINFNTSTGRYGPSAKYEMTGTCDDFIEKYMGHNASAMRDYEEFVWKATNLHTVPSFAYPNGVDAYRNPIVLTWDAKLNAYTTTISDSNGVLEYYDFEIDGLECTENADGTLTIISKDKIVGTKTNAGGSNSGAKNKIMPEGCTFTIPLTYTWKLEGKSKEYVYSTQEPYAAGTHYNADERLGETSPCLSDTCENCTKDWKCTWQYTCEYYDKANGFLKCDHKDYCNNDCDTKNVCRHNPYCDSCESYTWCRHYTCSSSCTVNACPISYYWSRGNVAEAWQYAGWDDMQWICSHWDIENCTRSCFKYTHKCDASHKYEFCSHTCGASCKEYYCGHSCYNNSACWQDYCSHIHSDDNDCYHYHDYCPWEYTCNKNHSYIELHDVTSEYVDFQDLAAHFDGSVQDAYSLVDPVYAYIAVTTEDHTFDSETDVKIELIDINGDIVDHIKIGEEYKLRYTYIYSGASKGFFIESYNENVPNYKIPFSMREDDPYVDIFEYRKKYSSGTKSVTKYKLNINPTKVTMVGTYKTVENPYPGGVYEFNSKESWIDNIKLDALTEDIYDDGYTNMTEEQVVASSSNTNPQKKKVEVKKENDTITVTWTYESEYEVFTSATLNATAYIYVDGLVDTNKDGKPDTNANVSASYHDETFSYLDSNGFFSIGEDGNQIIVHTVKTRNSETPTYAIKNATWQSDINMEVTDVRVSSGTGITQPIYSEATKNTHNVNFFLFYTVKLTHPTAHYYENKLTFANNADAPTETTDEQVINTESDVYELDVNNKLHWNGAITGNATVVDHIMSGETYLQRVIPTTLSVLTNGSSSITMDVTLNHDYLVYEGKFDGVTVDGTELGRKFIITYSALDEDNKKSDNETIYPAPNPNISKPIGISGSKTYAHNTSFTINSLNVNDRHNVSTIVTGLEFNTNKVNNKIKFEAPRTSKPFFKYGSIAQTTGGKITPNSAKQDETYGITEVLFKSNYTVNNKLGSDGWVNMVTSNKDAIVAAGQGFEIKVTVKYTNTKLTQYLARYVGYDDAQTAALGTSLKHTPQYCNISPLTLDRPISGFTTVDRLAAILVTGSNIYKDLYAFMSDNPDVVYSSTGIYDTPIIFDRQISYSGDFKTTTIVYTMKKSTESGVASSYSNMKFYTSQLASDSKTPGVVLGGNKADGTHTLTIWTPVSTTTIFNYPNEFETRYLGDAMEIGYTISTSGAENNFGHIVQ